MPSALPGNRSAVKSFIESRADKDPNQCDRVATHGSVLAEVRTRDDCPDFTPDPPSERPVAKTNGPAIRASFDPNDKIGPAAFGSAGFIRPGLMQFEIQFENDPKLGATAAAQEVVVTDPDPAGSSTALDADLDLTTFEFLSFGFGQFEFDVPPGLTQYETTIDLRPDGIDLLVPVKLELNTSTRVAKATFRSLDPLTGLPPDDPDAGFLPVNNAEHDGEGFFRFQVSPRSGVTTGVEITNRASIVFDTNAPILTPATRHTFDVGAPTSSIAALPAQTSSSSFLVSWSGSDDTGGSGIATFDVFVSDNGGPFTTFQSATTATSATFVGQPGHTYAFYSVATDNVGHRQATPASAQATTSTVAADTTGPTITDIELARDAKGKKIIGIKLSFSESLNRGGAETPTNYSIVSKKGTKEKIVALRPPVYDATAHRVQLAPVKGLSLKKLGTMMLTVRGDGNLTDASPALNRLDGDSNGTPGGNYTIGLAQAVSRTIAARASIAALDALLEERKLSGLLRRDPGESS